MASTPDNVSQAQLLAEAADAAPTRQSSLWRDAWHRMIRNKLAVLGMIIVAVFVLTAIFAEFIAPYGESEVVHFTLKETSPSWYFPMGIDQNGRPAPQSGAAGRDRRSGRSCADGLPARPERRPGSRPRSAPGPCADRRTGPGDRAA